MARPTLDDAAKLSHTLPAVRCTAAEKQHIRSRSEEAGLSISEYIRQQVFNGKVVIKQSDFDFDTAQQLRKIGVNLNQQTKKLNTTGVLPVELKQVWQKLETLLDKMME